MAPRSRSKKPKTKTGMNQAGTTPRGPVDGGNSAPATATVAGAPGPLAPAGDGTPAARAVAGSTPPPVGWRLLTSSAAKLWMTLQFVGSLGQGTAEQLADLSGLSVRTVYSALGELAALGLLFFHGQRGEGQRWELREVPVRLPETAKAYYSEKLGRKKQVLAKGRADLKAAFRRIEEAEGQTGADLFRQAAASMAMDPDTAAPAQPTIDGAISGALGAQHGGSSETNNGLL